MRVLLSATALAAGVLLSTAGPATADPGPGDRPSVSHHVDSFGYTYRDGDGHGQGHGNGHGNGAATGHGNGSGFHTGNGNGGRGGLLGLGLLGIL
ncbi:hypothetical protein [Streptomyces sp. CRN 30]|uniref:hypothetical protein n=1 Tax=Streptomyces sp. CRN 30 TaxID=3075613 RepID=UPI002A80B22A|nr:hypothetical protein [Streptomyces sp. CRN 30]